MGLRMDGLLYVYAEYAADIHIEFALRKKSVNPAAEGNRGNREDGEGDGHPTHRNSTMWTEKRLSAEEISIVPW